MTKRLPRAPRRRRFSLTRQGKGYVFVTVGVGIAAVNTGNNLLYLILGLLLSLLLVSGTLSDLALYQLRAKRRLPTRLYVGRPHAVEITLENLKRVLPSFSLEVREEGVRADPPLGGHPPEAPLGGHPPEAGEVGLGWVSPDARFADAPHGVALGGHPPFRGRGAYVVRVPAAAQVMVTSTLIPDRRGLHALGMLLVTTRYPFGLIEKVSRRGHPEEVLVYPEVRDVVLPRFPPQQVGLAEASARRGHGPDTLGLRAHRVEDEARDIHWRRSASFGRLVSRERAAESDRSLTLALDERPPADPLLRPAWDHAFEVAISECASLAVASLAHGISVVIRTEGSASPRIDAGGVPDPLLRFLALLQPAAPAALQGHPPEGLQGGLQGHPPDMRQPVGGHPPDAQQPLQEQPVGGHPPEGSPRVATPRRDGSLEFRVPVIPAPASPAEPPPTRRGRAA